MKTEQKTEPQSLAGELELPQNTAGDSEPHEDPWHAPWRGVELHKVCLNKYIQLGYISEAHLKLVVERLRNIQLNRQEKFKKLIEEMQRDEDKNKSHEYSARILEKQGNYNFNILFLNFPRYVKSLLYPPTRRLLQQANLIYPQGALMLWAFRVLAAKSNRDASKIKTGRELLTKFDFTVNLLSSLSEHCCSVFLVGGTASLLNRVDWIFQTSFTNIKILGRYALPRRKKKRGNEVCTLINKAAPTLLVVAKNASIYNFIAGKGKGPKIASFLVLDYPEALHDFSGKYSRKKKMILGILSPLGYLILPWKWPLLLCVPIFILKIIFLSLVAKKNKS